MAAKPGSLFSPVTDPVTVMEYFEIFLRRMVMRRKSAEGLGYRFALGINGMYVE